MKKVITLLIAALVAVTTFAQTNLAKDKTSIATSGNAYEGNDGNTGSRWESAQGVDPQSWQVDLGEATNFNAIQIVWEGKSKGEERLKSGRLTVTRQDHHEKHEETKKKL